MTLTTRLSVWVALTIAALVGTVAVASVALLRSDMRAAVGDDALAARPVRVLAKAGWLRDADRPASPAGSPAAPSLVEIGVVALLSSVVATLGLRWIVRRELEPLDRLRADLEATANGRDTRVDEGSAASDLRLLLRSHNAAKRRHGDAAAAQAKTERWLRDLIDRMPALVSVLDAEGRCVWANAQLEAALGLRRESILGRPIAAVRGPAYAERVGGATAATPTGGPVSFESRLTVDGDTRVFEDTCVPCRGPDGAMTGVLTVGHDVTDRHRDRSRLGVAERRLRAVVDHLPAVAVYVEPDERYGFANRHAQEVLGAGEPVIGRSMRAVLGDERHAEVRPWIERAMRGEAVEFESRCVAAGGERTYRSHYVPEIVDGRACGFFALMFDITELRASEGRLRLSEHRLQSITDNVPVLISYVDTARRLAFVNRRLQDWFGESPAAALGRPLRSVMGVAFDTAGERFIDQAFGGAQAEFEVEVDRGQGVRHLHTVYLPDAAPDGRVRGIFGLTSDVTVMRLAERQLQLLARVDTLTGIANRRAFDERLGEAMARCRRSRRPMGLIFLDVDHFKQINDSLGHAGGDVVLKTFAARITSSIRTTDLAARLAGDEFVVVLESLNHRAEAASVAMKVLASIRQPMRVLGHRLGVTSSLGVVYYDGAEETSAADLVARADRALYRGKKAGRDTFSETTL